MKASAIITMVDALFLFLLILYLFTAKEMVTTDQKQYGDNHQNKWLLENKYPGHANPDTKQHKAA